jgi:hypothetical protein
VLRLVVATAFCVSLLGCSEKPSEEYTKAEAALAVERAELERLEKPWVEFYNEYESALGRLKAEIGEAQKQTALLMEQFKNAPSEQVRAVFSRLEAAIKVQNGLQAEQREWGEKYNKMKQQHRPGIEAQFARVEEARKRSHELKPRGFTFGGK